MTQTNFRYAACAACGLVVGFFAGQEYVKYELRSALGDAVRSFQGSVDSHPAITRSDEPPPPKSVAPSPLLVQLTSKGFKTANPEANDYDDDITLAFSIRNVSAKDVRAFDGTLIFTDLLDNHILSMSFAVNDPIRVGQVFDWSGGLKYNQFIDEHQRLRAIEKSNLKVIFVAKKVLFVDGTSEVFDDNE